MIKHVTIKYEAGHSYDYTYEKSDLYCPECGKQEVWIEQGLGDYYEGVGHECTHCGASFTMPTLYTGEHGDEGNQLLKQLRS